MPKKYSLQLQLVWLKVYDNNFSLQAGFLSREQKQWENWDTKGIICYVQAKISKQTKAEKIISSKEQLHSTEIHPTPLVLVHAPGRACKIIQPIIIFIHKTVLSCVCLLFNCMKKNQWETKPKSSSISLHKRAAVICLWTSSEGCYVWSSEMFLGMHFAQ